eukprot:TRINITY_DN30148_c0_g1_i1.p1 TRINITY_DN30148_c0_g1~~TRINITY_DN30148_c0_g1_i1.p1  ORF type:complete len:398 (+),score=68.19 TRINITY_DN30148_c0_g1_i1:115-1308(+)
MKALPAALLLLLMGTAGAAAKGSMRRPKVSKEEFKDVLKEVGKRSAMSVLAAAAGPAIEAIGTDVLDIDADTVEAVTEKFLDALQFLAYMPAPDFSQLEELIDGAGDTLGILGLKCDATDTPAKAPKRKAHVLVAEPPGFSFGFDAAFSPPSGSTPNFGAKRYFIAGEGAVELTFADFGSVGIGGGITLSGGKAGNESRPTTTRTTGQKIKGTIKKIKKSDVQVGWRYFKARTYEGASIEISLRGNVLLDMFDKMVKADPESRIKETLVYNLLLAVPLMEFSLEFALCGHSCFEFSAIKLKQLSFRKIKRMWDNWDGLKEFLPGSKITPKRDVDLNKARDDYDKFEKEKKMADTALTTAEQRQKDAREDAEKKQNAVCTHAPQPQFFLLVTTTTSVT